MATTPDNPMDEAGQGATNEERPGTNPAVDLLHQVWLAGLGAVAVASEQTAKLVDELVKKGRDVEPTVVEKGKQFGEEVSEAGRRAGERIKNFADDVASRLNRGAEAAEAMMDERVRANLERLGYATREEVQAIHAKLDQLLAKLEDFQARRGRRPADSDVQ